MAKLPSVDEITALHRKYAPSEAALKDVYVHCQIVRDIALEIAAGQPGADKALVEVGALLHDIGVYRLIQNGVIDHANYIRHGLLGYELLKDESLDEAVCRFALLHTGVGITRQDITDQKLPLPIDDYVAETLEERIVMYADKFHSKTEPPAFNSAEHYMLHLGQKFGPHKVDLFKDLVGEFGLPDLSTLAKRYQQSIR